MGTAAEGPQGLRRIVSNSGPVLHLLEARSLQLLAAAGAVHIPRLVDAELADWVPGWPAHRPGWLRVASLDAASQENALAWEEGGLLHAGEAAAVALARQLEADWFLTDDAAARLVGRAVGLEVHGSLGVVLWAAAAGHLERPAAEEVLQRLAESSLWVSDRVVTEARAALDQLCA